MVNICDVFDPDVFPTWNRVEGAGLGGTYVRVVVTLERGFGFTYVRVVVTLERGFGALFYGLF